MLICYRVLYQTRWMVDTNRSFRKSGMHSKHSIPREVRRRRRQPNRTTNLTTRHQSKQQTTPQQSQPLQTSNPSNHFSPSSTNIPSSSNSTPSPLKSASLLVWFCPLGAFSQSPKKPPMKPLAAMQRWQGYREGELVCVHDWDESVWGLDSVGSRDGR
jgi:hypothetical protein